VLAAVCTAALAAPALAETSLAISRGTEAAARGTPFNVSIEASARVPTRLFAFVDPDALAAPAAIPCAFTPQAELGERAGVTPLSGAEGEPVAAGAYSQQFSFTPASEGVYRICAYLDATAVTTPALSDDLIIAIGPLGRQTLAERGESEPVGSRTALLPGAIEPAPVNAQLERELWERLNRSGATPQSAEHGKTLVVKPAPCKVPSLLGHTLHGARRLLAHAHCALGRVRRGPHLAARSLVVREQRPAAGRVLPAGSHVRIGLGARVPRR
jgi:hypothetical protein